MSTYITKIYRKQGGDELVVANGGAITVESGGGLNLESGGELDVPSGGIVDVDGAGIFDFYGEQFLGTILRANSRRGKVYRHTNYSTGATVLSDFGDSDPPILQSGYGLILIEASDGGTNLSARMYSANSGEVVKIVLMGGSVASVIIAFSGNADGITGVDVVGLTHSGTASALSSISMRQSAVSHAYVIIQAEDDGSWAIIEKSVNNVTERRS